MNAETMRLLASKGMSLDDILEVADAMERKSDPTNAERQARHRANKRKGVTRYSNGVTPPIERDHTPHPDISPDGENQDTRAPTGCPSDVEPETYREFAAIRRKRRAPITPQVIAGMRKEAGKAGWTLQEAIAEAVLRGWQSFKAEWVKENERQTNTGKPITGIAGALDRRLGLGEPAREAGRRTIGDGRADLQGTAALPAPMQ